MKAVQGAEKVLTVENGQARADGGDEACLGICVCNLFSCSRTCSLSLTLAIKFLYFSTATTWMVDYGGLQYGYYLSGLEEAPGH